MQIALRQSLKAYNTLGIDVDAAFYATAYSDDDINRALDWVDKRHQPLLLLGGCSNIVLTQAVNGLVLNIETRGIERLDEDQNSVLLSVSAGENWHNFVNYCIAHGYYGLENLSLIPGKAGAAPIQNIGAYGVELNDFFESLTAKCLSTGALVELNREACGFAYRDSVFKHAMRGTHVITHIRLRLSKHFEPRLSYGGIQQQLEQQSVTLVDARAVADAVCAIRRAKLPDPGQYGNVGSFFTNPVITRQQLETLAQRYPAIVAHRLGDSHYKVAAAWLIEQCGWKGYRDGPVGVSDKQALVLLNQGGASGQQILALAARIRDSVEQTFGIRLHIEPHII